MEEKSFVYSTEKTQFKSLLIQAGSGDTKSLEQILQIFDEEINDLSKFIQMPFEDAKHAIQTEFIAFIKSIVEFLC